MSSARVRLRVQASARRDEVVGVRDGVLIVRVTARAIEGRANESVRRLLAARLGVAKSNVMLVRGQRSREKLVQIDGMDQPALLDALAR